jgi:N-carbamoylputrescine amidase
MKVTITQIDPSQLESDWSRLVDHIQANSSEFVLLPEMTFSDWFCASQDVEDIIWQNAVQSHDTWLVRLSELGTKVVVGTAPRNLQNKKYNVAYVWTPNTGIQWIHRKTYLPNEDGYWESTWYDRAPVDFQPVTIDGKNIGAMICTELWFMQHAREYGQQGVHLIVNPRSTPYSSNDKWIAGGRTAGVIAGAYCLSSNQAGQAAQVKLGGAGWISDPEGIVLGVTSEDAPFITMDVNLTNAESAKSKYPRYVDDSEI